MRSFLRAVRSATLWTIALAGFAQDRPLLQVSTEGGQTTFHIGERIPLELSFTSAVPDRYQINLASYDRSGRMNYESFSVAPEAGWNDPLRRYFGSLLGFMGGGISSSQFLSPTGIAISLNLNEWVRFDTPGDYRVAVTSGRVWDMKRKTDQGFAATAAVTATPLLLHIIPATESWRTAKLQGILASLSTGANLPDGRSSPARQAAAADLRFLGTAEAIPVMAANLREDRQDLIYQCAFGLMAIPEPLVEAAIAALHKQMNDPAFPIGGWFLQTLTTLSMPENTTPEQRLSLRTAAHDAAWKRAFTALRTKIGIAQAVTAETLLSEPPDSIDAESKRQLGSAVAASIFSLPDSRRADLLAYRWDRIGSPSLLPLLRQFAQLPLDSPENREVGSYARHSLKSIAMRRWYGIDPAGAVQEIARQIGRSSPSLTAKDLWYLPARESFPQFEPMWEAALAADSGPQETLLGLLTRFGTGTAAGTVGGIARRSVGNWACAPQASALAYLVRFAPDAAAPLLERAAGEHAQTSCYKSLLRDISVEGNGDILHASAIELLLSTDPDVVVDAATYLAAYGKPADRSAIAQRYAAWLDRWAGRPEAFDPINFSLSAHNTYDDLSEGENLAQALIANQGWLATQTDLDEMVRQCVGTQMCRTIEQVVAEGRPPYRISIDSNGGSLPEFRVAQYRCKTKELLSQKVAQFSRETSFSISKAAITSENMSAISALRRVLADGGMKLEEQ